MSAYFVSNIQNDPVVLHYIVYCALNFLPSLRLCSSFLVQLMLFMCTVVLVNLWWAFLLGNSTQMTFHENLIPVHVLHIPH